MMTAVTSPQRLQPGDKVKLLSLPTGCTSKEYALTVGALYEVLYLDGSNVVTTTDIPGETGGYWRGRVEKI
jgi:hypothetical protein